MKLTIQLLSVLLPAAQADIMAAKYGACMNQTLHDENPPPGTKQGYHCHFSSRDCLDGEDWMDPMQVEKAGLKCSCDDDYNENVYTHFCYSMVTHQVKCAAERSDCTEGSYNAARYNAHHEVNETCAIGVNSWGAFAPNSCGKQCLCNFNYKSRSDAIEPATTSYGKCYNADTNQQYCAANMMSCAEGEEYIGPFTKAFSGPRCGCDRTHTGACIKQGEVKYCAVEEDSCKSSMTFLNAKELMDLDSGVDCRLCANTWDAPTVSPAPTSTITQPPTDSPTLSMAPTETVTQSPTVKTAAPSDSKTAAPSESPAPKCIDDTNFKLGEVAKKTCKWVANNKNKDNLCKRGIVKNSCLITCGKCCEDDPDGFVKGKKMKQCLPFLQKESKKMKSCTKGKFNIPCAYTCGRCCYSDTTYKFKVNGNDKPCSFINTGSKVKKFCKGETKEYCGKECGCIDYTKKE